MNTKQINEKIEALRAAHEHQIEMMEKGVPSSIEYIEYGDKNQFWSFRVEYEKDIGTGDVGCSFDKCSVCPKADIVITEACINCEETK